jgi:hypothetical protein
MAKVLEKMSKFKSICTQKTNNKTNQNKATT